MWHPCQGMYMDEDVVDKLVKSLYLEHRNVGTLWAEFQRLYISFEYMCTCDVCTVYLFSYTPYCIIILCILSKGNGIVTHLDSQINKYFIFPNTLPTYIHNTVSNIKYNGRLFCVRFTGKFNKNTHIEICIFDQVYMFMAFFFRSALTFAMISQIHPHVRRVIQWKISHYPTLCI